MDKLNTAAHSVRREAEERRDHLDIFREFLDHLGRASRSRSDKTVAPHDRYVVKR
jgi:hypothetical protein